MTQQLPRFIALFGLWAPAAVAQSTGGAASAPPPLYDNLGEYHHAVTTKSTTAQAYFDQGLRLLYAFNHAASAQSFAEGERLDPGCAMCAWGIALALGPNINAPMDSAPGVTAFHAAQRALRGADRVSRAEAGLIRAMAERLGPNPTLDRARRDSAYARAMRRVANAHPADLDAQVLYADALMNLSPWNYWDAEGGPRPDTPEIVSRLERVMEANPNHPGACHLFIHAEEAHDPRRAVRCAERLATLMPGAGHLVHMPGHIYIRVGRYADAIQQNRHAVHADESYLEGPHVSRRGIYAEGYYPHNYHFMSFAASMAGQSATAIDAARRVAEKLGPEVAAAIPWLEAVTPIHFWTLVTFGRWDDILALPMPTARLPFALGQAHYARGVAQAAGGDFATARVEGEALDAIIAVFPAGDNHAALRIARHALRGEIALRSGETAVAVEEFRRAVELEDGLTYGEPPTWYYPMRHSLGKALLAAGRPSEAERIYREDLARFPENGWSLFGLAKALEAQGTDAAAVRARFDAAWRHADVRLTGSRF